MQHNKYSLFTRSNFKQMTIAMIILTGIAIPYAIWAGRCKPAISDKMTYFPRVPLDTSGYSFVEELVPQWAPDTPLPALSQMWENAGYRAIDKIDHAVARLPATAVREKLMMLITRASLFNYEGQPKKAYESLEHVRSIIDTHSEFAQEGLYTLIFLQGVTALRRGENENCIMCRGESSCILPISRAARHKNSEGSRLAIKHFTEYLELFPEDLEVRWLLNLAHMTLGEHPHLVDPRFVISLQPFLDDECDIGRFRDIGHILGVNQFTQAGGAIMEDFDNDGLLDLVITSIDATCQMNLLRNTGNGRFEDRTIVAGLTGQLGGLNCVQTDYNNDGRMDIYVVRGAWRRHPMRPSLLRNNSDGTFTDVTEEAGLLDPVNSICASWADYDNDGWLDLFVCCEQQPSRLYRNRGNGTFEELSGKAGIKGHGGMDNQCKGAAWLDYNNDGYPDLFLNYLLQSKSAQLYRNNRDGTFCNVSEFMGTGIEGPAKGFSCWAWDYDNDGWLDIFATSYERGLGEVVKGLTGQPHSVNSSCLYRNMEGGHFKDVIAESGLDFVFSTMGSNFGDFDNDGFLDMYLGTGAPDFSMLVPNRMFKNIGGKRFTEITASTGTGNLQKGHGVACGDWDRDGNIDIFIEMGGAVTGDKYHNILFQNPGQSNNWLTIKLAGQKTNRPAIGARIKVVTAGDNPMTIHRHISSGSSFGANPLQQTIGLGKADRIAILEIQWPTSGTTQVFRDIPTNQAIAITEFDEEYEVMDWKPVPIPEDESASKMHVRNK